MSLLVDRSSSRIRRPNVVPQMARRRFVGEGGWHPARCHDRGFCTPRSSSSAHDGWLRFGRLRFRVSFLRTASFILTSAYRSLRLCLPWARVAGMTQDTFKRPTVCSLGIPACWDIGSELICSPMRTAVLLAVPVQWGRWPQRSTKPIWKAPVNSLSACRPTAGVAGGSGPGPRPAGASMPPIAAAAGAPARGRPRGAASPPSERAARRAAAAVTRLRLGVYYPDGPGGVPRRGPPGGGGSWLGTRASIFRVTCHIRRAGMVTTR
jgi:hypothetical protein